MSDSALPPVPEKPTKPRKGRALLVAALGVATMSYGGLQSGCDNGKPVTSGNLIAPPPLDAGPDAGSDGGPEDASMPTSGNLLPPPPEDDSGIISSGNLLAPPPDAGGDAGPVSDGAVPDGGDAGETEPSLPGSGNLLPPPAQAPVE